MISYEQAVTHLQQLKVQPKEEETVPLVLSAGRILSREILAPESIPSSDNSAMDGYALRGEDTAGAGEENPVRLRIVGEAPAGTPFAGTVSAGETVAIMTGGVMPPELNAVAQVEIVRVEGEEIVLTQEIPTGRAVRSVGEDMREGERIFQVGRKVYPGDVGTLATLGVNNVPVRVKPKVAVLSTGSELVDAVATPGPGQLRNSTGPALLAAIDSAGGEGIDLGIVGDDPDELESMIETGLQYDMLLTTGGVSAGAYDHVQHLLPQAGVVVHFHKVSIKPGKPVLFGTLEEQGLRTYVFGLPGNPVSSLVTFELFARPIIDRLLGVNRNDGKMYARLTHDVNKKDNKRHFQRGILTFTEDGHLQATSLKVQSSGAISSMSHGDCLIVLREETSSLSAGSPVEVLPLR